MKLERLPHHPESLLDFFHQGLDHLGGICERSWHDRLQLVAEGPAAALWNEDASLLETELRFVAGDDNGPRDAATEVFPGCPLTFRLCEALRPVPLPLERGVLAPSSGQGAPPASALVEKLWLSQHPGSSRWMLQSPLAPAHHFSILALVRCEIQAIDQHWSLHRVAFSLSDGQTDDALARDAHFLELLAEPRAPIDWPLPAPAHWQPRLEAALAAELLASLALIRTRQENYLRRELNRIDDYFRHYEQELTQRGTRGTRGGTRDSGIKAQERLAAAQAEHARRRADQVQRHEIRVIPHLDAILLLAEPAWRATVAYAEKNQPRQTAALFVPRSRRWISL